MPQLRNQSPGSAPAHAGAAPTTASTADGKESYHLGEIPDPAILAGNAILVAVIMVVVAVAVRRKIGEVPRGIQNFGEWIVECIIHLTEQTIGPGGEKYVPLIGTLFFFILVGNLFGQIPYLNSPTANLSTTLALGIIVFLYVQYIGIRSNGIGGYLKHFCGPMWMIAPLLFPIEVISELVKPFTLAMRLFGNIFGEDTVIIVLASLAVTILPKAPIIPLQLPVLILGLLTALVQAVVFSLLSCIYISLQIPHDTTHSSHSHSASSVSSGHEEPAPAH